MASNIIVARGGVEYVPPVSLAFWRWLTVFVILMPFFFDEIIKKKKKLKQESFKLFFLGLTGCAISALLRMHGNEFGISCTWLCGALRRLTSAPAWERTWEHQVA